MFVYSIKMVITFYVFEYFVEIRKKKSLCNNEAPRSKHVLHERTTGMKRKNKIQNTNKIDEFKCNEER